MQGVPAAHEVARYRGRRQAYVRQAVEHSLMAAVRPFNALSRVEQWLNGCNRKARKASFVCV